MPRPALLALVAGLAALAAAPPARAQAEVVPAEHPVYAFLADQRVAGRLPEFDAEILPTGRRTVRAHLDSLAVRDSLARLPPDAWAGRGGAGRSEADGAGRLGAAEQFWLGEFRREFFEPLDRVHSYLGDGRAGVLDADAERTLFYHRSDDWRAVVVGEGAAQVRAARGVGGEDRSAGGLARAVRLTVAGGWRGWLGLYSSTLAGTQTSGDAAVLRSDPALAPLYYVSRDPDNMFGPFDQTSASLRVRTGPFSAEIAHERLRVGASADAPLVLSANADYLPFVRLGLHTRVLDLQAVHAALSSRSVQVAGPDGDNGIVSPERYLALHRLRVRPTRWLDLAFTEMVVYGLRGPEIAYLNPLFPIKAAEHALYDRDNSLFALEATVRPARGVELYGTWFVDDLATAELGDGRFSNKWAMNAGGSVTLPVSGWTAFGEYTRVEPHTYTHRFQEDGFFYNAYTHNAFGLGHPIGPNADQWLAGVQAWLPARVRARAVARYRRRGENYTDETGAFVNVGGDVEVGTAPPDGLKAFLSGDRFEGWGLQGQLVVEPLNDVEIRLFGDLQRWDRAPDEAFVRAELAVRL
ncbi:capsule assembly Wzi family protein [Rubrivirga sp. S365]|uniref:capsule assembly Wzi family protein n=1 Tax=Rubrivirga sp. S365 TaxID=3076080 RepID=UPI0028CA0443|nr:capsule assembly Wzi family protein [Rubrivirga sp. S365]MDT7857078.1 capsule assembly Wzi family protein [Rubrivirga sp. S365]